MPCPSPKPRAFVARNDPQDHSVSLRETASHRFDDLFADYGRIAVRPFFGGEAIWDGRAMIALVWNDSLYFTTDEASRPAFVAEGCKPFSYPRGKRVIDTSWFSIPERLYDDPAELARWARAARDAALAKSARKKKKRGR